MTVSCARAVCHSVAETQLCAARLAETLRPGDVVCLYGELGAGKTYFTKGLLAGLGGDGDEVTSPTFVLLQTHRGRLPLYHFDAYRLHGGRQLVDIGSDEILSGDGVSVIEWADRVPDALPEERIEVHMAAVGPTDRSLRMVGRGRRAASCVRRLVRRGLLEPETPADSA